MIRRMAEALPSYDDWKAPQADGGTLLWPDLATLADAARQNKDRLDASDAPIGGTPLSELRRDHRAFLNLADAPIVATGHQCELYHPGVWAKNAVLHHAAEATGGQAVHVVVETDAPKHLNLRLPPPAVGRVGVDEPITDDPDLAAAKWSGRLAAPSPAHIDGLRPHAETRPLLGQILNALATANVEQAQTFAPGAGGLVAALTAATHELDWSLGLRHAALPLGPMLLSDGFLTLVRHLAAEAEAFAADYNASLADYRQQHGIDDDQRPMPDLAVTQDTIELPLWFDDLATGRRERATLVRHEGRCWLVAPSGDRLDLGREEAATTRWLMARQLRLAPRALCLTLFLRLIACDVFVHGIGGGRYDQVTDRLIARHFNLAPPKFAVATATLRWPSSADVDRVCPPCLKMRRHRLYHNLLGDAKTDFLSRPDKPAAFAELHAALAAAARRSEPYQKLLAALDAAPARQRWEAKVFDRELFYALQPADRLTRLIDRFGG